jgi:hypothetical protein
VNPSPSAEEGDMQTATVAEIKRDAYVEARKAWHHARVQLVHESLLRRGDGRDTTATRKT